MAGDIGHCNEYTGPQYLQNNQSLIMPKSQPVLIVIYMKKPFSDTCVGYFTVSKVFIG